MRERGPLKPHVRAQIEADTAIIRAAWPVEGESEPRGAAEPRQAEDEAAKDGNDLLREIYGDVPRANPKGDYTVRGPELVADPGEFVVKAQDGAPEAAERFESVDMSQFDESEALVTTPLADFAAVDEPSALPLLGDDENTILAAGGTLVFYGDGGAGKTTLEIDLAFHLAAGLPWLGLPVAHPLNVLVIENEGPRGKFRVKLRQKLAGWDGPPVGERIRVLEEPWALFTFAAETHRERLRAAIEKHAIDVLAAAPVHRLGIQGGGTPEEVGAFILNLELVRAQLDRPVAVVLAHHENKAGDVSGAWEGVPDTLAHVQARGNGATRLFWQKVRWGSTLHGKAWTLLWRDGESFEVDDTPEVTDDDVAESIVTAARENPGASWRVVETHARGRNDRRREVRDELLESGELVNLGKGGRFALYAADDPVLDQVCPDRGTLGAHPVPRTGLPDESVTVPRAPPIGAQGHGAHPSGNPPDADAELEWR